MNRKPVEKEKNACIYPDQLAAILDNIADGLVTIDEDGIVQNYNKACTRLFGYTADEIIGRNIGVLMPKARTFRQDQKNIDAGLELEGLRKDGSVFPLEISFAEVRLETGRIFSGIIHDITSHKNSENEMKRCNEELEKFAYIASHDLKAPLRNIDDLAKWVIEDTKGIIPETAQQKLELLCSRVAHLETLLDDILSYSRAGRIVGKPVEIDMRELVSLIVETHVPAPFQAKIKGHLPVIVSWRTPLEQIFGNLVSNAVKHHDRGTGLIEIEMLDASDGFMEFIVRDDGPGIAPEFHERVFQMFQTLQPRDKVGGSGLGLAITKKLVEWQGGKVWIESNGTDRGTAFHFTWPRSVRT